MVNGRKENFFKEISIVRWSDFSIKIIITQSKYFKFKVSRGKQQSKRKVIKNRTRFFKHTLYFSFRLKVKNP
jgi:hypothetical protein